MKRLNCWEFMRCGREPGGAWVGKAGVCPAAVDETSNGLNHGKNGGRICWAVAGTFCADEVSGSLALKELACGDCEFYHMVRGEEGFLEFVILKPEQVGGVGKKPAKGGSASASGNKVEGRSNKTPAGTSVRTVSKKASAGPAPKAVKSKSASKKTSKKTGKKK